VPGSALTGNTPNFGHVETPRAHRESLPKGTGVTIIIVVIGLLALIAAAVVAVAGVASNSGSTQPLSDNFVISGQHLNGLSTRQLALYGIAVRLVDLLGSGNPATPVHPCLSRRRRQTAVPPWSPPLGRHAGAVPGERSARTHQLEEI
jgi:hypothetical protein